MARLADGTRVYSSEYRGFAVELACPALKDWHVWIIGQLDHGHRIKGEALLVARAAIDFALQP